MAFNPQNSNGQKTMANSQPVVLASDESTLPVSLATNTPTIAAGSNLMGKVGIDQTTVGTTNGVSVAQVGSATVLTGNGVTGTGSLRVTLASDTTANSNPFLVRHAAATTSSGLLYAKVLAAATTNATSVKASAGALYGWHLVNNATSTRYVRIFNKASAPTVGTDSPVFVLPLPASGGAVLTPGLLNLPLTTGFAYAITGAAADLDTTAVTANDVVGAFFYI
jgi:hypothetical protein